MKMNLNSINEMFSIIDKSCNICIAGHKAPDGDCIGSVMTLYEILKPNKNLTVCIDGSIPYNYKEFIDESILLSEYEGSKFDAVITVDCSDAQRLGKFSDILNNANATVCIDHHNTNKGFADINIIDHNISSTGELIYEILKHQGIEINKKIAELMYIAILTDTGKFSYSNTSKRTHEIAGNLIDKGVDVSYIDNIIYNSKPSNVVKAYIDCISSIELLFDNKIGLAYITQKILSDNNVKMGDIDGVVEFIREIKEVEISCVLKEYDDSVKVSLRSKNDVDVSKISALFGGGGHKKAAGFEIDDNINNVKKIIINELRKYTGE